MRVTLRQLEVFLALAQSEHLGTAAERLHLSPSATSSALASLEQALGAPLFDRVGRGIRLNNDGRRVRELAARTLLDARELEVVLDSGGTGRLVIGSSTTIATHVLGPAVASFAAAYPGAAVEVLVGNTQDVAAHVVNRRVDLAFVEGAVLDGAVHAQPWRTDRLVLFVAPSHPLAQVGRLSRQDLGESWVLREPGSGTRETFMAGIGDDGPRLGRVVEVGSSGAVAAVVAAGGGVGCLSEMVVARDLANAALVELTAPEGWQMSRTLWRLVAAAGEVSSLGRAFLEHLGDDAL